MKQLTAEQFHALLEGARIKPRLRREVRFVASTVGLSAEDWEERELLPVTDRSGNKGVLLISFDAFEGEPQSDTFYVLPYELSRGIISKTGRAQAIICDFCRTWQTGSRSGSITFPRDARSVNSITFLCCADLACSLHVRSKTSAARTSRSQLREDLTTEDRVERLRVRLRKIVGGLGVPAVRLGATEGS